MIYKDKKRGDKMNTTIRKWMSLTVVEQLKWLEITADQNWMGRFEKIKNAHAGDSMSQRGGIYRK